MSEKLLKVEGYEGLYRDPSNNAIINKNKKAWVKHKQRRRALQEKDQRIESLENEVAEMKAMLQQLLEKKPTTRKKTTKSEQDKSE